MTENTEDPAKKIEALLSRALDDPRILDALRGDHPYRVESAPGLKTITYISPHSGGPKYKRYGPPIEDQAIIDIGDIRQGKRYVIISGEFIDGVTTTKTGPTRWKKFEASPTELVQLLNARSLETLIEYLQKAVGGSEAHLKREDRRAELAIERENNQHWGTW